MSDKSEASNNANHPFSLQPFPSNQPQPNLKITGNITRIANKQTNKLTIHYTVSGDIPAINITPPSNTPTRKFELWEETCFEFFIGIKDSQKYWEFNLSPAGHWNIYSFDNYRQGMKEETAFNILPFTVENLSDSILLNLEFDLDKLITPNIALEVAITTVIKDKNSQFSYWALTHKGKEANFHLRDSFVIEL
jgi:hypothetical protein